MKDRGIWQAQAQIWHKKYLQKNRALEEARETLRTLSRAEFFLFTEKDAGNVIEEAKEGLRRVAIAEATDN